MAKLKTPKAWTKHARGQECTVRLVQICNYNTETTVFAHVNGAGMGMKGLWGCFACSDCNDVLDGRTGSRDYSIFELQACHDKASLDTLEILIRDGVLKI